LPNILAGEWLVPELLQDDATPDNLAQAMGNWIRHRDLANRARTRFGEIHQTLAVCNSVRVVEALRPLLTPLVGGNNSVGQHAAQGAAFTEATRVAA
ncbi:MAG: hypothetical protein ACKO15_04895, partial [Burkholderiales bacterium]